MVCSVHWYAYLFEGGDFPEFISYYEGYCLYVKYPNCPQFGDYHTMIDGFGSMINFNENHFEFLPHDFEFMWFS